MGTDFLKDDINRGMLCDWEGWVRVCFTSSGCKMGIFRVLLIIETMGCKIKFKD